MARQGRGLIQEIIKNLFKSLSPRNLSKAKLIGTDHMGTKYFEVPADPQGGKRKPGRTFEPKIDQKYDQEVPPEWEAWLRGRRKEPPTEEEINRNLAIISLKQKNSVELSLKFPSKEKPEFSQKKKGKESFPLYREYEVVPGTGIDKEDKKPQ